MTTVSCNQRMALVCMDHNDLRTSVCNLVTVLFAKPRVCATAATVRCASRSRMARPSIFNQYFCLHFCMFWEISFFLYTYWTIIQNVNYAWVKRKSSPYVRATRKKHFDTLTPLTHAHVLTDFDYVRILHARYIIIHNIPSIHRVFEKCKKIIKPRWQWNSIYICFWQQYLNVSSVLHTENNGLNIILFCSVIINKLDHLLLSVKCFMQQVS